MIEIKGHHNSAMCFTDDMEKTAEEQILMVCDRPEFAESKLRIMPDVHAGLGCTIGTTMTIHSKVVPNMVGVDIGCGMETVEIAENNIDFARLDEVIRKNVPSGRDVRQKHHSFNEQIDLEKLRCRDIADIKRARLSIGTLGGGNHFIEAAKPENGRMFVVVHSGSRHLGNQVAKYYQDTAYAVLRKKNIVIPRDLAYAEGDLFDDYIHDMQITQQFALINRKAMVDVIFSEMGLEAIGQFSTIHNYIDIDAMILRKGAVSAKKGEKLLIPINMRDGSLICMGKGNSEWNFSAPHGAGRVMSRRAAFEALSMEEFRSEMEKAGIFTTSVKKDTLDEAPMAYKTMGEIKRHITSTADVLMHIRPLYNFKAAE